MNITALVERLKNKHGHIRKLTSVKHRRIKKENEHTDSKSKMIQHCVNNESVRETSVEDCVDIDDA